LVTRIEFARIACVAINSTGYARSPIGGRRLIERAGIIMLNNKVKNEVWSVFKGKTFRNLGEFRLQE
jgi:hypothetical protein